MSKAWDQLMKRLGCWFFDHVWRFEYQRKYLYFDERTFLCTVCGLRKTVKYPR